MILLDKVNYVSISVLFRIRGRGGWMERETTKEERGGRGETRSHRCVQVEDAPARSQLITSKFS